MQPCFLDTRGRIIHDSMTKAERRQTSHQEKENQTAIPPHMIGISHRGTIMGMWSLNLSGKQVRFSFLTILADIIP